VLASAREYLGVLVGVSVDIVRDGLVRGCDEYGWVGSWTTF
jgi:hypothetical protein